MKLTSLKIPSVLLRISFYLYECCACMFVCYMWTVLVEARRCGSLWNCCYARLWATIAMLSIKHQYSGKGTSALKWYIISPAPKSCMLREVTKLYIWNLSLKEKGWLRRLKQEWQCSPVIPVGGESGTMKNTL